jgi:sulfofructose kinase
MVPYRSAPTDGEDGRLANAAGAPPRVICLGLAALDRIWRIAEFRPAPRKLLARDLEEAGGGMAATGAVTIARLGGQVALWSRVGEDSAGAAIRAGLACEGVDVTHVRVFPGALSSVSGVFIDAAGERLVANFRGRDLGVDPSWLPLADVVAAGATLADVRWPEGAIALFAAARKAGIPTVLDAETGAAEHLPALLPLADYAIFSMQGLADLDAGVEEALAAARAAGARHAGVTQGADGYLWRDDAGLHRFPAIRVAAVDTNGAGDAFHGAFALALAEGRPLDACLRMATATAALKCTRPGTRAGLPDRAALEQFLADTAR